MFAVFPKVPYRHTRDDIDSRGADDLWPIGKSLDRSLSKCYFIDEHLTSNYHKQYNVELQAISSARLAKTVVRGSVEA
jgi:hypothetical protein